MITIASKHRVVRIHNLLGDCVFEDGHFFANGTILSVKERLFAAQPAFEVQYQSLAIYQPDGQPGRSVLDDRESLHSSGSICADSGLAQLMVINTGKHWEPKEAASIGANLENLPRPAVE